MKPGVFPRIVAAESLYRITDNGAFSNIVLRHLSPDLDPAQRLQVHHAVMETLRNLIRWDVAIEEASNRPVSEIDGVVLAVLRLLAQELIGDGHAPHGAVDSAVEAVAELGQGRARGFVNAVGRRLASAEPPQRPGDGGFDLGIPQWMFDRMTAIRGVKAARAFFAAANAPAPVGIRVRPGSPEPPGVEPVPGIPGAAYSAVPVKPGPVDLIDPASTAVAVAVDARRGQAVVDLAAAPGGKTAALWDAMEGEGTLVAVDVHEGRVNRMRDRMQALGVGADLRVADARSSGLPPGEWDRVLLDAPCSGIGTLRRRPEIRHRVRPGDPAKLGKLQRAMLDEGLRLLKPDGYLVYSVCTVFPEETIDVVADVDARPADVPGEIWGNGRLLGPDTTGTDGMFISVVRPD